MVCRTVVRMARGTIDELRIDSTTDYRSSWNPVPGGGILLYFSRRCFARDESRDNSSVRKDTTGGSFSRSIISNSRYVDGRI